MTKSTATSPPFEPEFIAGLKTIFEERIVFNQVLGLKIIRMEAERVVGRIEMKPELVGHATYQRIHGGVISAALDAMAGIAVMSAISAKHMDEPPMKRAERFAKLGTIDLRVDYMRPGIGERFSVRAEVLRLGSRVATTRMEFLSEQGEVLAAGMAAYITS